MKKKIIAVLIGLTLVLAIILASSAFSNNSAGIITVERKAAASLNATSTIEEVSSNKRSKEMVEPVALVYTLKSYEGGPEFVMGSGTAFSIAYDKRNDRTYFLTNDHICDGVKNSTYKLIGERSLHEDIKYSYDGVPDLNFKIIKSDPARDLCLMSAKGYVRPVKVNKSSATLSQFDELFIVGGPTGNFPIMIKTYFAGYLERAIDPSMRRGSDNPLLMISEEIHPGHSGSPIFNAKGDLVGIVFASSVRGAANGVPLFTYGGVATGLLDILEFLEENNIR